MKKVILITGASSGMGKEAAKKLIHEGHIVYTVARRIDQMQDLSSLGGNPMQLLYKVLRQAIYNQEACK